MTGSPQHLLHVFPTFAIGGVPVRIAEVLNRLGGRYRHTILALDGVLDCRSRLDAGLDVALAAAPIPKGNLLAALIEIRAELRRRQPGLLLTYNWGAIEWGLANRLGPRLRHVHFESGFGPEEADGQILRRSLFRRLALARADALVVPSTTLVKIATEAWKIDPAKIRHIPNGVDVARFAAAPDPAALPGFRRSPSERVVGTLAPLRAEKNVGRLLHAFAALAPDANLRLLVIGDGAERAGLERLAANLGIADRTHFAGHCEAPERALGLIDVFVISSDTEQMPNTLLQAMAAGRAVAAVDVGDVKPILAPENRRFVAARGDAAGLAQAIAALLADDALRAELGRRNAAHVAQHYDQGRMVAAYRELYDA